MLDRRRFLSLLSPLTAIAFAGPAGSSDLPVAPPTLGLLLFDDDFRSGLTQWHVEAERPGRISAQGGVLALT